MSHSDFLGIAVVSYIFFRTSSPFSAHFSSRYSRAWGPVNRWAEVVDIDVLRRLFENALAPRRSFIQGNQWVFSARKTGLILFFFVGGVASHKTIITFWHLGRVLWEWFKDSFFGFFLDNVANEFTETCLRILGYSFNHSII